MHIHVKVFSSEIIKKLNLEKMDLIFVRSYNKISKLNIEIKEVHVDYYGRTVEEGKKFNF